MRLVLTGLACSAVVVAAACGGDESGSAPTSADGGAAADGGADSAPDASACAGDACGGVCGPCGVGASCTRDADCASDACEGGVCVQTAGCYPSGFCWENPRPTGASLYAIRGVGPDDVWAVGDQHYVVHWDGKRWRAVPSDTDQGLLGVAFADASHGWAVGGKGTIVAYDGTKWTKQANVTQGALWSVFALAADDVWAVGDLGTVSHFDGTGWTSRTGGGLGRLRAVWAANKDDVWIAGDNGQLWKWGGGTTWTPEAITGGATPDFHTLGGPSASSLFAGTYGSAIYRRSGSSWDPVTTLPNTGADWIEDIFALDATHAYAAGIRQFARWDGSTWTPEAVTSPGRGFFGVWAAAANDLWLSGERGELLHHDGTAWKELGQRFDFTTNDLGARPGMAPIGARGLVMVSQDGQVARKDAVTGKWTTETIPGSGDKVAVSANGPNDIVAVGDEIHRWDGVAWKEERIAKSSGWNAITRVTPSTPWIAGNDGLIGKWTVTGWVVDETTGTSTSLRGIWAADALDVWAVGLQGVILHWDGAKWDKETSPSPNVDNNAVWGTSANDVWIAVGGGGKILHRVGGVWREEEQVAGADLHSVTGTGPNDVWFTGKSPAGLVHWDGAKWTVWQHTEAWGTLAAVGPSIYVGSSTGRVLRFH